MKKFYAVFLAVFLFTISYSETSAVFTDWKRQNNTGTTHQDWGNPTTKINEDDANYYTKNCLPNTDCYQSYHFDFSEIPTGSIINSIEVQMKVRHRYNLGGWHGVDINYKDQDHDTEKLFSGTTYNSHATASTSWHIDTFYYSNNEPTHTDVSDYFDLHEFNSSTFSVIPYVGISGTSSNLFDIEYIWTRINYELDGASGGITSADASPSAQLVNLDFSGNTATSGASIYCEIDVFETCYGEGIAGGTSETPIASIELDPNNTAISTQAIGNNRYLGYGYSASSSAWIARDIEAPYNPGMTCTYPLHTVCTERIYTCNSEGCYWTDTIIHEDSWTDGDLEVVHDTQYQEPEPDDPLSWLVWKIKKTLFDVFVPNMALSSQELKSIKDTLLSRAPFAYIMPIFSLDLTDPGGSEDAPDIIFPSAYATGSDYTWSAPGWLSGILSTMKGIFTIVIWLGFIAYLFNLSKRILPR